MKINNTKAYLDFCEFRRFVDNKTNFRLTIEDHCNQMGISRKTLWKIFKIDKTISRDTLSIFAEYIGTKVDDYLIK